jgi:hypothetical protein
MNPVLLAGLSLVALGVVDTASAQITGPGSSTAVDRAMTPSFGPPVAPGAIAPESGPLTGSAAVPTSYGRAPPASPPAAAPAASGTTNSGSTEGPGYSFGAAPPPITSPSR